MFFERGSIVFLVLFGGSNKEGKSLTLVPRPVHHSTRYSSFSIRHYSSFLYLHFCQSISHSSFHPIRQSLLIVYFFIFFITASQRYTRRLRSNTDPADLLPHDIITYGLLPPLETSITTDSSTTTDPSSLTMSTNSLNILQVTALKELPKFTGAPSEKITHFINSIEQIGRFAETDDSMLHSLATIKLGGAAYNWYENNKSDLGSWSVMKTQLLERFRSSLSMAKTQLKERKQQPGEPLLSYYDDVVDLCKQVDSDMPLHMIVDYLQDGLRDELKVHVKRHMKIFTVDSTPAIFLKIARTEEELQHEISSAHQSSVVSAPPYFAHLTTATSTSAGPPQTSARPSDASNIRSSRTPLYSRSSNSSQLRPLMPKRQYQPCLICDRSNHRTIDCYSKQPSGCYKCGAPDHNVRQCPQVFQ